jgi:hypothetical protein
MAYGQSAQQQQRPHVPPSNRPTIRKKDEKNHELERSYRGNISADGGRGADGPNIATCSSSSSNGGADGIVGRSSSNGGALGNMPVCMSGALGMGVDGCGRGADGRRKSTLSIDRSASVYASSSCISEYAFTDGPTRRAFGGSGGNGLVSSLVDPSPTASAAGGGSDRWW